MSDEFAIQQTLNTYSFNATVGDLEAMVETFAPDEVWDVPGIGAHMEGREAILAGASAITGAIEYMVQLNSPAIIEIDGDKATARSIIRECGKYAGPTPRSKCSESTKMSWCAPPRAGSSRNGRSRSAACTISKTRRPRSMDRPYRPHSRRKLAYMAGGRQLWYACRQAKDPSTVSQTTIDENKLPFWKRSHYLDRMTFGELVSAYFQHYTIMVYLDRRGAVRRRLRLLSGEPVADRGRRRRGAVRLSARLAPAAPVRPARAVDVQGEVAVTDLEADPLRSPPGSRTISRCCSARCIRRCRRSPSRRSRSAG